MIHNIVTSYLIHYLFAKYFIFVLDKNIMPATGNHLSKKQKHIWRHLTATNGFMPMTSAFINADIRHMNLKLGYVMVRVSNAF